MPTSYQELAASEGAPLDPHPAFRSIDGCLFRSWLWIEDFCETNFGAYILSEPTYPIEVVKDIGGDSEVAAGKRSDIVFRLLRGPA